MTENERRRPARGDAVLTEPLMESSDMARRRQADTSPLTQERLHQLFFYDTATGLFWRYKGTGGTRTDVPAGACNQGGYVQIKIDGRTYSASHLAWLYVHGCWPKEELDHRQGVRHDNRVEKLREATHAQNVKNKHKSKRLTPGLKGTTRWYNKWMAQIAVDGKKVYLGLFKTPEEAHAAYCEAARRYHGEFWNPGVVLMLNPTELRMRGMRRLASVAGDQGAPFRDRMTFVGVTNAQQAQPNLIGRTGLNQARHRHWAPFLGDLRRFRTRPDQTGKFAQRYRPLGGSIGQDKAPPGNLSPYKG